MRKIELPVAKILFENLATGGEIVGKIVESDDESLIGLRGFVRYGTPGQIEEIKIDELKKGYFKASLLNLKLKEDSCKTECPYFYQCGGCDIQHISYEEQLKLKKKMVIDDLLRAKVDSQVIDLVSDVTPSLEYKYRTRVKVHIDSKTGGVGFYQKNTRNVLEVKKCLVTKEKISEALLYFNSNKNLLLGIKGNLSIELLEDNLLGLAIFIEEQRFLEILEKKDFLACNLFSEVKVIYLGKDYHLLKKSNSKLSVGSFSQVNNFINTKLVQYVLQKVQSVKPNKIEDLYAGSGNFSIPLAQDKSLNCEVIGVELDPKLVKAGDEYSKREEINNLQFICNSVERYLREREIGEIDLVIADPPRSGLGKLVPKLKYAENLVLISCHLPSFVNDIRELIKEGYEVKEIELFDMFPQTNYLEICSMFKKSSL